MSRAAERRALLQRNAELDVGAVAPGSMLACLDGGAGEAIENACEKAVFADPQSAAAAVAYTGGAAGAAGGRRRACAARRWRLRSRRFRRHAPRASSSTATASPPMCWRPATAAPPSVAPAFALVRDTGALKANLKVHAFDSYVARYAAAWSKTVPTWPRSSRPRCRRSPARRRRRRPSQPVSSRYDFPSAASIPPVSIMNAEPPLPKEPAAERSARQPQHRRRGYHGAGAAETSTEPKRPRRQRASIGFDRSRARACSNPS